MKKIFFISLAFYLLVAGCKERFDPPLGLATKSLLVVEANLNPQGPASVRLSRTTSVYSSSSIVVENNALVTIEGKDNTVQQMPATGSGNYSLLNPAMIIGNEYRLRIKTAGGDEFLSAYVKAKRTPLLDSITWERTQKGVQISVNTKDPLNSTGYYRWDYVETWELRSVFKSLLIWRNGALRDRNFPAEDVRTCWKNSPSTGIFLANSLRLETDIISKIPIVLIPENNEKLFVRYSIIAKQYALDADAYNFYEILKKNTEDIGTFFGPLPSELKGNINCVNKPGESVIGFVTASEVNEKRIFIDASQVLPWRDLTWCEEYSIANNKDSIQSAIDNGWLPVAYTGNPPNRYIFSLPYCVDCTTRGGVTIRPSFW